MKIFISYRRRDSAGVSHWLYESLSKAFGPRAVFMDTEAIRAANHWQDAIKTALDQAGLVVAVMGPTWLKTCDEFGRRRLDLDDDWVRNEIQHAIESRKVLIPLLLDGTTMPPPHALPQPLQPICSRQAYALRDDTWRQDSKELMSQIVQIGERLGLTVARDEVLYPPPRARVEELSADELAGLKEDLPQWTLVSKYQPNAKDHVAVGLAREFEFDSFERALDFMAAAKPFISRTAHHPSWRNLWRTVSVWLTTWDIGHRPSSKDRALAKHLDRLSKQEARRT